MAIYNSVITDIRNLLEDRPESILLNGAINSSVTTMTVDGAGAAALVRSGVIYEFDDVDGTTLTAAEAVRSDSQGILTPVIRRAQEGTTAVAHADNANILVAPLYRWARVKMALDTVMNTQLLPHLYEVQEHEVTTSATTNYYNSSATACEFILDIYQDLTTSTTNEPSYIENFRQYHNVDTDLFSNGKFFVVNGGVQNGTEKLYINCAHPLAIGNATAGTTASDPQLDVIKYLAIAKLLEWGEGRATQDQNVRKTKVGDRARLARYFREEGTRMLKREAARLQKFAPPRKEWLQRRPRIVS